MDELISILNEIGLPYAYDHFAEGESPNPPFICYLLPGSDNFAADGRVYYKINDVHIELYTDYKNTELELKVEAQYLLQQIRGMDRQRKALRGDVFL